MAGQRPAEKAYDLSPPAGASATACGQSGVNVAGASRSAGGTAAPGGAARRWGRVQRILLLALLLCRRDGGRAREAAAAQSAGGHRPPPALAPAACCARVRAGMGARVAGGSWRLFAVARLRGGESDDGASLEGADIAEGSENTRSPTPDSDASMREEAEDTGPLSAEQLAQLRALPLPELIPLCEPDSVPRPHALSQDPRRRRPCCAI